MGPYVGRLPRLVTLSPLKRTDYNLPLSIAESSAGSCNNWASPRVHHHQRKPPAPAQQLGGRPFGRCAASGTVRAEHEPALRQPTNVPLGLCLLRNASLVEG